MFRNAWTLNTMNRNDGLWIFLAVVVLNVFGLAVDYCLLRLGQSTVTGFARRNEWAAWMIVALQMAGTIGLSFHFFASNGGK